jgi:hypothetical protein
LSHESTGDLDDSLVDWLRQAYEANVSGPGAYSSSTSSRNSTISAS